MSSKTRNLIKLCVIFIFFFSSACSSAGQQNVQKISHMLKESKDIYGLQGCISNDIIFFRGSENGEAGFYQYIESQNGIKLIKNFSYIGPLICIDDEIYFSAIDGFMSVYKYSQNNLNVFAKNIECSVVLKKDNDRFLCFIDKNFDGTYSLGLLNISNKLYIPSFSTEQMGPSEGMFFSSGKTILGIFLDPSDGLTYLKSINFDEEGEILSVRIDCDMLSVISNSNGALVYKCDSELKVIQVSS